MAGDAAVPRFTVWLTWLAPVQLFVIVTWLGVAVAAICRPSGLEEPPRGYWQACVLFRIWVVGFAPRFFRKFEMMAGFSVVSDAIVFKAVVTLPGLLRSLDWTGPA